MGEGDVGSVAGGTGPARVLLLPLVMADGRLVSTRQLRARRKELRWVGCGWQNEVSLQVAKRSII